MLLASELIKCGSRVVHKFFNKTMQELTAKPSKGGLSRHLWKRRAWCDRFVHLPLISAPDYIHIILSIQKVAILLNLPQAV